MVLLRMPGVFVKIISSGRSRGEEPPFFGRSPHLNGDISWNPSLFWVLNLPYKNRWIRPLNKIRSLCIKQNSVDNSKCKDDLLCKSESRFCWKLLYTLYMYILTGMHPNNIAFVNGKLVDYFYCVTFLKPWVIAQCFGKTSLNFIINNHLLRPHCKN